MALLTTCPSCGLDSDEIRCPRCFSLKVVGCGGSCAACNPSKKGGSCTVPSERPSDKAAESVDHPGTPLER